MASQLKINPYLQFQYIGDDQTKFVLVSPKPGDGLQTLEIDRENQPQLFEVFTDLSTSSFNFLDVEYDLGADDRELLQKYGVLVEERSMPEMPLFECKLNDVEPTRDEFDLDGLLVNPTFRFEPFDLANFASLTSRHLSPESARVWIRSHSLGVDYGYWLDSLQADVLSKLQPGSRVSREIGDDLLSKLVAAHVLIESDRSEVDREAGMACSKKEFSEKKYTVLEQLFPREQVRAMSRYYRNYVDQGFMQFGDDFVRDRYRQHNEPLAAFIHPQLTRLISEMVGEEVKPSYVYAASYKEGAVLRPHIDREQCEYSISLQVDYFPEPVDGVSPWPLFVEPFEGGRVSSTADRRFEWTEFNSNDTLRRAVHLANGDGLLYKGRELIHYRHTLPAGHRSTSLFFHFVPATFAGTLN